MSRVLVTGATGFVGAHLVTDLQGRGYDVVAATREMTGDLDGNTDWQTLLTGVDYVIHTAGRAHVLREQAADPLEAFRQVNVDASLNLARQAAQAGVRRFIFLSSVGVLGGETHGQALNAATLPVPHTPYAQSKHAAEQGLADIARDSKLELVIIRPPLILGRNPKGNLGTLVRVMQSGLPLPLDAVTRNRRDLVSRPVLSDLIIHCIAHPRACDAPWLVSDGITRSTRDIVLTLARHNDVQPRLLPIPVGPMRLALNMAGRATMAQQLFGDLELDMSHTREVLGWSPPQPTWSQ